MKIYVAGPMRDLPGHNFSTFNEATARLRAAGHTVCNPAELSGDESIVCKDTGLREALGADLAWICAEADAIALLPGWENSKGAKAEYHTAIALGLDAILIVSMTDEEAEDAAAEFLKQGLRHKFMW